MRNKWERKKCLSEGLGNLIRYPDSTGNRFDWVEVELDAKESGGPPLVGNGVVGVPVGT